MKFYSVLVLFLAFEAWAAKPQVFVQKAAKSKVAQTLLFPSLVKSRIESNIRSDADLIVVKSHVALGQKVRKGDVLLELKNQDTSMNYNHRLLRAPVAGVVAALMVQTGEYVQKGQDLALINDPSKLYLKMEIPVAHHHEMKRGLSAKGKNFKAHVSGIGAVLDASTGTVPVELEFDGPVTGILPGTITNVEVKLNEEEKLLLPGNALYYSGEKTFLPLLEKGKVKKVEVKTTQAPGGQIEVLEGLTSGVEVIVGAGEFLKDGDEVEVVKK